MTKTSRDVVVSALRYLNVVSQNGEPSAAIFTRAEANYITCHEGLRARFESKHRTSIHWDYDDVPDEYFGFIDMILAGFLVGRVPMSESKKQEAKALSEEAETSLVRSIARRKQSNKRLPDFPVYSRSNGIDYS